MDKGILKKFAIESRNDLMVSMERKISEQYVDENFIKEKIDNFIILKNNELSLKFTKEEYRQRELLIKRINNVGINQVIEESAYTWFNRIIAVRYMELNDILPLSNSNETLGFRVLSDNENTLDPEILKFSNLNNNDLEINFDKEYYAGLDSENKKFKYLLLLVVKKLGTIIPQVFGGNIDYIDLLIPDNLLNDSGFVNKVVTEIPINNFEKVEIIGWLYQYYNQTEKDRVIGAKKAYKKNEIAYATQLFTPDWIVKYMVENSLGKYVIEHNADESLIDNWKYFIKDNLDIKNYNINPTELTFIDPCMGSGHILVYAFEVLYQIYESYGYNKNDIPELILENNLYGLDIDDRAGQLSVLSVVLKACSYNKKILSSDVIKNLNIMSMQESSNITDEQIENIDIKYQEQAKNLRDLFINAKELGSLILTEQNDYNELFDYLENDNTIFTSNLKDIYNILIKQTKILSSKYDIVVTNPPYLNNSVMSPEMKKYVVDNYKDVKSDLFSAFTLRNSYFGKNDSYLGFMTPNVWMYISSYENLRNIILNRLNIDTMIDLAKGAFFKEATVDIVSFVLCNKKIEKEGLFIRLDGFKGGMELQEQKVLEALTNKECEYIFKTNCGQFNKILGMPIAYWVSNRIIDIFNEFKSISDILDIKQGLATANNNRFLKMWWEINHHTIKFDSKNAEDFNYSNLKWVPYNKGGAFRKWYGNFEYVLNWENDGYEIKNYKDEKGKVRSRPQNTQYYFKKSITWSDITSGGFSMRIRENGSIHDVCGMSAFSDSSDILKYILGIMNTKLSDYFFGILNPTLHLQIGDFSRFPIIMLDDNRKCNNIVEENIFISKTDWDSFETSCDFKKHPLMPSTEMVLDYISGFECNDGLLFIEAVYVSLEKFTTNQFNKLKSNEEELNRIFIDIYGLQDELTPEVEDKDITIRKADRLRETKSLISYAVGCMFGRYSLDEEGIVYAGGEFDINRYKKFKADTDNIIPICDDSYFGDDIVTRFIEFIKVVYGEKTLYKNLDFITEPLRNKGAETHEETLRRYFTNEFFKDHCKIYKKKPIYWLFDSGKRNGFKCLIYMHRYNENTVPKIRLDYLHKLQNTYQTLLSDVDYKLTTELSMNEKKELSKKQIDINNKLTEISEYDEKIAHIADMKISIDLDDGVTVNYAKFEDVLGKIK